MARMIALRRRIAETLVLALAAFLSTSLVTAETGSAVTRTSRPVRLLRSWEDAIKIGGKNIPRRVEVVFDYSTGIASEISYGIDGGILANRQIKQTMPAPTPEEIAEAFDIVRADTELSSLFSRFGVVLEGGFLLQEGKHRPCGPGSRCLQVFLLSSDRAGLIRLVVVDLGRQSIPYRTYSPTVGRIGF